VDFTEKLLSRTKKLSEDVNALEFTFDGYVYNPLDYAWDMHAQYLKRYVMEGVQAMFLGMNPGPFGMMQTGVPFGEVNAVRDWLRISGDVGKPEKEHPWRPVVGFAVKRSEISGLRLWGLMHTHYKTPDNFAKECCVFNYCPLGFLMNTKMAKNETPDHLPKDERLALEGICDSYLSDMLELINPRYLIGVGKYAEEKFMAVNRNKKRTVGRIIHPSPGNPQAHKGWAETTAKTLIELGIWSD